MCENGIWYAIPHENALVLGFTHPINRDDEKFVKSLTFIINNIVVGEL